MSCLHAQAECPGQHEGVQAGGFQQDGVRRGQSGAQPSKRRPRPRQLQRRRVVLWDELARNGLSAEGGLMEVQRVA